MAKELIVTVQVQNLVVCISSIQVFGPIGTDKLIYAICVYVHPRRREQDSLFELFDLESWTAIRSFLGLLSAAFLAHVFNSTG